MTSRVEKKQGWGAAHDAQACSSYPQGKVFISWALKLLRCFNKDLTREVKEDTSSLNSQL
jgi:hypothetical protein